MKRIKGFLFKTAIAWVFIILVGILFGLPSWDEFSVEWIMLRLIDVPTLASLFILAVAFVILANLRYWVVWCGVLIVLAVMGSGVDLPHRFVLYPEQLSIVRVLLTLVAILAFWVLEKLESKYTGSGIEQLDSFTDEDEIVKLNLGTDVDQKEVRTKND